MTIAQDRLNLEGNNFPSKTAKTVSRAWSMMSGHKWRLYQRSFPAIGFPLPLVSGRNKPDATMMVSFEDGSALIIITDGMVMFVDSVCRAMASGANWHGRNGAILDAAAFSPGAVDGALLSTYQQWRKLLADDNLAPPSIALSDQGEELAGDISLRRSCTSLCLSSVTPLYTGTCPSQRRKRSKPTCGQLTLC